MFQHFTLTLLNRHIINSCRGKEKHLLNQANTEMQKKTTKNEIPQFELSVTRELYFFFIYSSGICLSTTQASLISQTSHTWSLSHSDWWSCLSHSTHTGAHSCWWFSFRPWFKPLLHFNRCQVVVVSCCFSRILVMAYVACFPVLHCFLVSFVLDLFSRSFPWTSQWYFVPLYHLQIWTFFFVSNINAIRSYNYAVWYILQKVWLWQRLIHHHYLAFMAGNRSLSCFSMLLLLFCLCGPLWKGLKWLQW